MAINQKAISVKIDLSVYNAMEFEVYRGDHNRNRLINRAIDYYLEYLQTKRDSMCIGAPGDREALVTAFVDRHFPHWRK